jgi:hypothetical protein
MNRMTCEVFSLAPIGGPRNAKRSSLMGKLTSGGLGKPLGRGEGADSVSIEVHGERWGEGEREQNAFTPSARLSNLSESGRAWSRLLQEATFAIYV